MNREYVQIMKKMSAIVLAACLVLATAAARAAEDAAAGGERSLDAMSDDLKFQNGAQFYRLKLYDKALQEFAEYLEIYHNGAHRGEALMRMGDIHFSRMHYLKSLKYYQAIYEELGGTDIGIEAMYKSGICQKNMGYENKAIEVFKAIAETYGETVFGQQAKTQLDALGILKDEQN